MTDTSYARTGYVETTVYCRCGDEIPDDALMCDTCRFAADPFTVDRLTTLLTTDPGVIGRARIQPAEAARFAAAIVAGLEGVG